MTTSLVIHGHFYQPPRENPWTDIVEREPSAEPYHDWNERIHDECYRPNGFARIVNDYGHVESIVNNYINISFNFGPTLLSWLEREHPETYARILEADLHSARLRGGHGNAIAQAYNHAILPLCNERDRLTQVRWGIADFRHRFNRDPESLWLAETACNDETLGTLIDENMRYVILSPHQAERVRRTGAEEWWSVADGSIDTTIPYRYFHTDGSGRSLAIFFYDGHIARALAFEGALASSHGLVDRFANAARGTGRIVNVATDGESYGHHFHYGDRCLAYALESEASTRGFAVTNYGEFLQHHPPTFEVEIKQGSNGEGTAWSCAHGVGRWRRDCGCQGGALEGWNQAWREPLRRALDFLRDEVAQGFETTGGDLFKDPWAARDAYIELVINNHDHTLREEFFRRHTPRMLTSAEQTRALTFLEMQRNAMLMYTSCGWFFADISGIETVQIIKYAGRVLELADELGLQPSHKPFLELLAEAKSNIPKMGDGAAIYRQFVESSRVLPQRVAAHLAIFNLVDDGEASGEIAGYSFQGRELQKQQHGRFTLATGHFKLAVIATGKRHDYAFAAMRFGSVDFYCALKEFPGAGSFATSTEKLWQHFPTATLPIMLRLAQEEFGPDEYGLEHVLPKGRRRISEIVFGNLVERFSDEYAFLYKDNRRSIEMLQEAGFKLPTELRAVAEFTLGKSFQEEISNQQQSQNPAAYQAAVEIADKVARYNYHIDRSTSRRMFEEMIVKVVRLAVANASSKNIQSAASLITLAEKLNVEANLERAQEVIYQAFQSGLIVSEEMRELALMLRLAPRPPIEMPSVNNDLHAATVP